MLGYNVYNNMKGLQKSLQSRYMVAGIPRTTFYIFCDTFIQH